MKTANTQAMLDEFIRLSILEGAAGVRSGEWTRNLVRGKESAQAAFPGIDPQWFARSTSIYNFTMAQIRKQQAKYRDGDDPAAYLTDIIYPSGAGKNRFYVLGQTLGMSVLDYTPTKMFGLISKMVSNQMFKEMRSKMRHERNDSMVDYDDDSDSGIDEEITQKVRAWVHRTVNKFTSKATFDANAAYLDYYDAMSRGEGQGLLKRVADQYGISSSNLSYVIKNYSAKIEELAARDPLMRELFTAATNREEYESQTPSKFDFKDLIEARTASALTPEVFAGGRERLEDVFNAHTFTSTPNVFSFFIPPRKTAWGEANWVYVDNKGRTKVSLWRVRSNGNNEKLTEINAGDLQSVPSSIGNLLGRRYLPSSWNPATARNAGSRVPSDDSEGEPARGKRAELSPNPTNVDSLKEVPHTELPESNTPSVGGKSLADFARDRSKELYDKWVKKERARITKKEYAKAQKSNPNLTMEVFTKDFDLSDADVAKMSGKTEEDFVVDAGRDFWGEYDKEVQKKRKQEQKEAPKPKEAPESDKAPEAKKPEPKKAPEAEKPEEAEPDSMGDESKPPSESKKAPEGESEEPKAPEGEKPEEPKAPDSKDSEDTESKAARKAKIRQKAEELYKKYVQSAVMDLVKEKFTQYKKEHPKTKMTAEEYNDKYLQFDENTKGLELEKTVEDFMEEAEEALGNDVNTVESLSDSEDGILDALSGLFKAAFNSRYR